MERALRVFGMVVIGLLVVSMMAMLVRIADAKPGGFYSSEAIESRHNDHAQHVTVIVQDDRRDRPFIYEWIEGSNGEYELLN